MMKLAYALVPPALACCLSSVAVAQELPNNWSKTYTADEWQSKCETAGRGGCRVGNTYYYDADAGILVAFFSATPPPVIKLVVASTKGECAGGTLTAQGTSTIKLVNSSNGSCTVAGGKIFREANRITNSYSQLDIGMFRHTDNIVADIKLSSGDKLSANIPMQRFGEKLDAVKQQYSRGR